MTIKNEKATAPLLSEETNPVPDTRKQYLGSKPNWNIYELHKYEYTPSTISTNTPQPAAVPININIISKAFISAGIDFKKHRDGISYLIDLDLTIMNQRLIFEKEFANEAECNYAISEYKKFLIIYIYLQATSTNTYNLVAPSMLVDKIWHWHLLFLERYLKDCMKICGHIIYHSPRYDIPVDKCPLVQSSSFNQVLNTYKTLFGYAVPTQLNNSICSKCGSSPFIPLMCSETTLSPPFTLDIDAISNVFTSAGIDFNKLRAGILYLINLDLSMMIARMIDSNDFKNETECNFAINEYKKYLIIYIYLRGKSTTGTYRDLVPAVPVDMVWHWHILDLEKYIADCHRICGEIVMHNPRFDLAIRKFPEVQTPKYAKVFAAYPIIFGHKAPFEMWGDNPSISAMCCDGMDDDDDRPTSNNNGSTSNNNGGAESSSSTSGDVFSIVGIVLFIIAIVIIIIAIVLYGVGVLLWIGLGMMCTGVVCCFIHFIRGSRVRLYNR